MKLFTLMFSVFLMNSCGSSKATKNFQDNTIPTGKHKVLALGSNTQLPDDLSIAFDEDNSTVGGFNGCNTFSGPFKQTKDSLSIGMLIATQRYCDGELGTIEKHFMQALGKANNIQKTKTGLKLLDDKGAVLLEAERINEDQNTTRMNNDVEVTYKAITRGTYKQITLKGSMLSVQNKINEKPKTITLSEKQSEKLSELFNGLDLQALETLEPPSKTHQYDGALIASLKVEQAGNNYQTQTFDHGNPPKAIKAFVDELLSLSEKVE